MEHAGFSDTLRDRKRQLRHLLLAKQKLGIASGLASFSLPHSGADRWQTDKSQ